ncbi:MAG: hypothetical protein JWR50_2834 [Mucilaginibacter sp.]|nr:hypothetical protein [Mucilaginibacter sp.]
MQVAGNIIVAFVESHSKKDGKNTLTARSVDNSGNVSSTDLPVGSIDFTKMSNAGTWHTTLTPDKKHIAVIGQLPHEKNMPDKFQYFLLDDNLKEIRKGEFSFTGYTKEISIWNFLASNKGDLFIMSEEFDKSYKYPVVYEYLATSSSANIIPVIIADPDLRVLNYTASVDHAGELIITGYSQQKKAFNVNDIPAVGSWYFNSSKPQEIKTYKFEKPIPALTARNIVYNGDTFFLVGEQYSADKEPSNANALQRLGMEDNYIYHHNDIVVTGFSNDGSKKFDITLNRKWSARNTDNELMVASGVINNKLAVIFNDQYGKYINDEYHRGRKLPVAVTIHNDGLMDAPIHFEKELDVKLSSYTLLPFFFSTYNNRMVLLSGNEQTIKTVTFQ